MRSRRRVWLPVVAAVVVTTTFLAPSAALAADGPGYGGNADQLDVGWQKEKAKPLPTPTTKPTSAKPTPVKPSSGTPTPTEPSRSVSTPQAPAPGRTQSSPAGNDVSAVPQARIPLGTTGFGQAPLVLAATTPIVSGQVEDFSLSISGVGFESGANVVVQIGNLVTTRSEASVIGALKLSIPGVQLTSSEPGQTISATGLGPSGAPLVLTGSIPPVPKSGGPMVYLTWIVALVAAVWGGRWVWRNYRRPAVPDGANTQSISEGPKT